MAGKPLALGPFDLLTPIGRGGMAVVWAAKHRGDGLPVAVKIIQGPRSTDPEFRASFAKEVRAMARLRHPHIVTILDQGEITAEQAQASEGRLKVASPYFVMELLEGGTLRERTPLTDWGDMKAMLRALLLALAHAHARGLTHLDLKPDNVLLADPGLLAQGAKLTDFGIAQAVADPDLLKLDDDEDGVAIGTPLYMAPEQCLGQWRRFGPWTDLYALGCMAFELATGMPPYPRRTRAEALVAHLEAARPLLKAKLDLPPGFEAWLGQLLERDPVRRYQRAADALWALEGLGAPTLPPSPRGRTIPPAPDRTPGEDTPPIPQVFEREKEADPDPVLLGAGLGLFGLREPPMVGRLKERGLLWQTLRQTAREKHPRAIVLRGASGVGKSRLARWIAQRAHEWGVATVLTAVHGPVAGSGDGLTPMLLRHFPCTGLGPAEAATVVRRNLPALKPHESSLVEALAAYLLHGERGAARENHAVVCGALEVLARERPVILHIDDAQWGPEARSLVINLQAERSLMDSAILTLITVQEEALQGDADAQAHLEDLTALPGVDTLTLRPLPKADHAYLVRQLLGLDGALADEIERRTQGHPLFAIQLVGDWVKRGLLEVKGGGFTLKSGARASLPEDLHRLWESRLDHLLQSRPASSRRALEMAAILGQHVDLAEWTDACAAQGFLPRADLLDVAAAHGFIVHGEDRLGSRSLSFAHGLLRESLEQSAREGDRWLHHQRAASIMLTRRYLEEPHVFAERLARHRLAARDLEGSLEPLRVAAEGRRRHSEAKQALALLNLRRRTLTRMGRPPSDPLWGAALALECELLLDLDRGDEALELAQRAAKAAATHGWADQLPDALECVGRALRWSGEMEASRVVYRRALRAAKAVGDKRAEANSLRGLAAYAWDQGDYPTCAKLYRQALPFYQSEGDHFREGSCLLVLGHVALRLGKLGEAEARFEEARSSIAASGSQLTQAKLLEALSQLATAKGEGDKADAFGREAVGLYRTLGARSAMMTALNGLGDSARRQGALTRAEVHYRRAMEIDRGLVSRKDVVTAINLGLVLLLQGRYAQAKTELEGIIPEMESTGRHAFVGWASACLAAVHAGLGEWAAYDHHLGAAEAWYMTASSAEGDDAVPLQRAGELALGRGEGARAKRALVLAEGLWARLGEGERLAEVRRQLKGL